MFSVLKRSVRRSNMQWLFDLESDGLLTEATKLHCAVAKNIDTGEAISFLNTLLQSAGAVLMKKALVLLSDILRNQGLIHGKDYAFVANVHDEWQMEVLPSLAEEVGRLSVESIRKAGETFNFACPLDATYRVENTWAETH